MLDNVIKQLKLLPPEYADFYARRCVQKIQDKTYLNEWYFYFQIIYLCKKNITKMPFPLVCYDVNSSSESEAEDCKDDIKPLIIPVSYIFLFQSMIS